jgi:hypothetical protein
MVARIGNPQALAAGDRGAIRTDGGAPGISTRILGVAATLLRPALPTKV